MASDAWDQITRAMDDDNRQNANAANAGDIVKHTAWLALLRFMSPQLKTVVETHAGGGVYRVPQDRMAVSLPGNALLAQHQKAANLPAAPAGYAYYSASADQALLHLPPEGRYIAFDVNPRTRRRLEWLAEYRGRRSAVEVHHRFSGGKGHPSVGQVLEGGAPEETLVMVDPLDVDDLLPATALIPRGVPTVVFAAVPDAVTERFSPIWEQLKDRYHDARTFRWAWAAQDNPGRPGRCMFLMLLALPRASRWSDVYPPLVAQNGIFIEAFGETRRYRWTFDMSFMAE